MGTESLISLIPGIIALLSYGPYIRSIRAKITLSSYSTRLVLAVVNGIILMSAIKSDVFNYLAAAIALGSFYVTYVAIRDGAMWQPNKFDAYCTAACSVLIALWLGASDRDVALFAALAVQLVAWSTTLGRLWSNPASQDPVAFSLVVVSALCQIAILDNYSIRTLAQPCLVLGIAGTIVAIVAIKAPEAFRTAFSRYWYDLRRFKVA